MKQLAKYYTDKEIEEGLGRYLAQLARDDARKLLADDEWRNEILEIWRSVAREELTLLKLEIAEAKIKRERRLRRLRRSLQQERRRRS